MNSHSASQNISTIATAAPPPSQLWLRAIELTARIESEPGRLLGDVVSEWATRQGDQPALLSKSETFTYAQLSARVMRYARWALKAGIAPGDRIALVMPTRPEYLAAWMGVTMIGGVVALVNTQLPSASLSHALKVAEPGHIIVDARLRGAVEDALSLASLSARLWTHGGGDNDISVLLDQLSPDPLDARERPCVTVSDRALLIYTSGTTGMPKAAYVSHQRIMSWGSWFAGLTAATPQDRMYDCLPVHHSVGGVVACGSMFVAGGSVVLVEKFSARSFWTDIVTWDCTIFQYIGELCRYLVNAPPSADERKHRLRLACGNGLRGDVWESFQARFGVPRILEFYAATEGNFSLFNVEGKPGAIGRIPPFLKHRFPAALVRFDPDAGEPARNGEGLCILAPRGEVGEALGRISGPGGGGRFEGYTNAKETDRKILRDVLVKGDAWFRTGDLMRVDEKGFYYFVDRIGDTFRWKGENVATAEVTAAITAAKGVMDVTVYGVEVPGADGRAGMAAVVIGPEFDPAALHAHLVKILPAYARPLFLRLRTTLDVTDTFKHKRQDLFLEGFDPAKIADPILIEDPVAGTYIRLDPARYAEIAAGHARL